MSIKNTKLGGTDFATPSDRVKPTDLNDTFDAAAGWLSRGWGSIIYDTIIDEGLTIFNKVNFISASAESSDSGDSWSAGGYGQAGNTETAIHDGSNTATSGVTYTATTAATFISSDSGISWAASSVAPSAGSMTKINDMSMKGSTVVAVGDSGANPSVSFSSDSGDNFADATTGPTVEVHTVSMFSSTVGYLVDNAGNIWKTIDGGDNWTDTTYGDTSITTNRMTRSIAIDADNYLIVDSRFPIVNLYDDTAAANASLKLLMNFGGASGNINSNIVKATNGNFYWVYWTGNTSTTVTGELTLFKYDGTKVSMRPIGIPYQPAEGGSWWRVNSDAANFYVLSEGADNILYLNLGIDSILEIDVRESL